jgi:hypothetical protein
MQRFLSLAAACALTALATATEAQTFMAPADPAPLTQAQAPVFSVGERWEFSFENALEPQKNEHYSQTVASVDGGQAALAVNDSKTASVLLDANGNLVKTASGSYEPSDGKLQFPLSVGKRWSLSYVYRTGTWTSQVDRTAKVVGVERIHTAQATSTRSGLSNRQAGPARAETAAMANQRKRTGIRLRSGESYAWTTKTSHRAARQPPRICC